MNQILYEDTGNNSPTDIKKIIRFFSITILVFGLALIGFGIFGIVQWVQSTKPVALTKPKIVATAIDNNVKIEVTHDKSIDKLIYSWNGGPEETVVGRGRTIDYLIEMPAGENELTVEAIDTMGEKAVFTGKYAFHQGVDIQTPKLEVTAIEAQNIIHVRAEDETEIAYITYRWNNDEEVKIDTVDESKTIIDTNIPLPERAGEYELTVVAVDKNNNIETKVSSIKGLKQPEILKPTQYGEKLTITVTDEVGLDYVIIRINDKAYKWKSDTDDKTSFVSTLTLEEGENKVIIDAKNKSGLEANTMRIKCKYTP